jgi:thioesterase domain-containing protein
LRSTYILDVYDKALSSYVPKPYSGRCLLFKASGLKYAPHSDWLRIIAEGLEVHERPGSHMDMIREDRVALWGELLRRRLNEIQKP